MAVRSNFLKIGLFLASWGCVAFGQPVWSTPLSIAASAFGYALFWRALVDIKRPFWIATSWFLAVQLIQIGWLASDAYMGSMIYGVYVLLCLFLGLQFGWMSTLIPSRLTVGAVFALSGFWVILEWLRTFLLTGFTWNPAGLALASNTYSIQWVTLFGVYGLSFWVILTNLFALKAMSEGKRGWGVWAGVALFPYLFGFSNLLFWESRLAEGKSLSVGLVQTSIKPEEKDFNRTRASSYIHPVEQWKTILSHLQESGKDHFDLIVMPEGTVPLGARRAAYSYEEMRNVWALYFGVEAFSDFPPMEIPFARTTPEGTWKVSNSFWAQSIANHYQSDLIVGFVDGDGKTTYNSAFHFRPQSKELSRYDKRVLVPVGEYLPLREWDLVSKYVFDRFGISDSFDSGNKAKVFQGALPIGISICSEETYGHLVREGRVAGAELFVNISNDGWFPNTLLPWHHYLHGKIRAVENGVGLLRSCNKGVTGAVDCFGREISRFSVSDRAAGTLAFEMPVKSFPTLYTLWGDGLILFSSFSLALSLFFLRKKKLP